MRPQLQIVPNFPPVSPFAGEDLNDEFFSDLDKAFDEIQMAPRAAMKAKAKSRGRKKAKTRDLQAMKATFIELAQVHLRPTLRYLKAIEQGVASKDLCEIVHYVIGPIIGKTRKVGLVDQTKALITFQRNLKAVVKNASRKLSEDERTKLAEAFAPVQKAFKLDFRGHSTAVVNLLGFYKALNRNKKISEADLKKLFAIGIPSLTMLRKSSIAELVSLSGIHPEQMAWFRRTAREFNVLSLV